MAWLAQQNKGVAAAVNVDPTSAVKPRRPTGELSVYAEPPEGEVAIEEFERVALDRLRGELLERPAAQMQKRALVCRGRADASAERERRELCWLHLGRVGQGSQQKSSKIARRKSDSAHCAAVLKGIEDARSRGKKPEELQVCCLGLHNSLPSTPAYIRCIRTGVMTKM